MRKKSHISLAKFLMNNMKVEDLNEHKKAFYIGSILPDCRPSFLTRKHSIDATFPILIEEIKKITVDYDMEQGITGYYCRHLGVITHYLADYFTFPHNSIFQGSIKEHCVYEKKLKFTFKSYVQEEDTQRDREQKGTFHSIDEIIRFIVKTHREYLMTLKVVKEDCQFIVDLVYKVVDAILQIFELNMMKLNMKNEQIPIECL